MNFSLEIGPKTDIDTIPALKDVYIHRIGRSGRFGRKGVAINFVTQDDINKMRTIQTYYQTNIEEMPEDISEFI